MKSWSVLELIDGFKTQDTNALARAITYAESLRPEHQKVTQELLAALPLKPTSQRIGISGTPGVGKSTFIESLGLTLTAKGHRIAVLAVDPTSQVSGGSILGDKTRMELLAREPRAFIRPSPSGGTLGGVARKTREAILLCEAFGFDLVLVETVGVGQSETAVARIVDCFVMLLQPGAGDDLQGIKRGILELVDMVVVTKADGANKELALAARHHYEQALHILRHDSWQPPVIPCSALEKTGLNEVWLAIQNYFSKLAPQLESKRAEQRLHWLDESLRESVIAWFEQKLEKKAWHNIRQAVESGKMPVQEAVNQLLNKLK